jgi:hypothetical protein
MRGDDSAEFPADQGELLLWDMEQAFFPQEDGLAEGPVRERLIRDALCIDLRISLAGRPPPAVQGSDALAEAKPACVTALPFCTPGCSTTPGCQTLKETDA